MLRRLIKIAVGAAVATVFVLSLSSAPAPKAAPGGNCLCPDIYAPVICSNGVTYPNQCVASCHHAKDCHRTGDI